MKPKVLISLFLWVALLTPVAAQDYDAGMRAYRAKDYAGAVRQWTPLAKQGIARAQNSLGYMYAAGREIGRASCRERV